MKYRPEIDGLRAVAVVSVMFFHSGFDAWGGGLFGVDVFFVISGYLITTIIDSDIREGRFSIAAFYERRARRMLPALFAVCLLCVPFAWLWMLPMEFDEFSRSLVAVVTFSANFFAWQETAYFAADSQLKPLLHMWSLAVEEQFYLVFPVLLLLLRRQSRMLLLIVLCLLALASLGLFGWASKTDPVAGFYLLPMRAWELCVGAIVAVGISRPGVPSWRSEAASALGLAMIATSVFFFDENTPSAHLLPVAGTGLLLACAQGTSTARLLSLRPLVGLGLISYSAYLLHQPLFAFARMRSLGDVSSLAYLVLNLATFALAYVLWRWVEQPFRRRGFLRTRPVLGGAFTAAAILVAVGVVGHHNEGFPDRNEVAVEMADPFAPNFGLSNMCEGALGRPAACQTSEEPEILVWGDSYAMHLVDGIVESEPDVKLIQMTMSGCGPLFDIAPVRIGEYTENWARRCIEFSSEVKAYLSLPHSVRYAVLSSPFDQYLSSGAKVYVEGKVVPATADLVEHRFLSTLNWLAEAGITPVVVSPPPRNGRDIPLCLARSVWLGLAEDDCSISVQDFSQDQQNALRFLERIAQEFRVVLLPDYLCDGGNCKVKLEEDYVYRDAGHLSRQGSRHLGMDMDFYRLVAGGGAVAGQAAAMPSE